MQLNELCNQLLCQHTGHQVVLCVNQQQIGPGGPSPLPSSVSRPVWMWCASSAFSWDFCHQLFSLPRSYRLLLPAMRGKRSGTGIAGVNDQHHGSVGSAHRGVIAIGVFLLHRFAASHGGVPLSLTRLYRCPAVSVKPAAAGRADGILYAMFLILNTPVCDPSKKRPASHFLPTIFFHLHQFYPKSHLKCGRSVIHFSSKILKEFFINILK